MTERTPLIAGNWKMNLNVEESLGLVKTIAASITDTGGVDVLVAPPFTALSAVKKTIGNSRILLGAQNMHSDTSGAYTGEIAGSMLLDAGCTHVILGHSERRTLFNETSEMVDLKVKAAGMVGLIPILCIGETIEQREAGHTFDVLKEQLGVSLQSFQADRMMSPSTVLAYEPVWAIGTGMTATPEQAQEVHRFIRDWIEKGFDSSISEQIRILYGGSVKSENVAAIMEQPDIDGALVGGASLKGETFLPIIHFEKR